MSQAQSPKNDAFTFNLDRIPRLLRSRYFLIGFGFAIWVLFFDRNNIVAQFKVQRSMEELVEKKAYFETEIGKVKRDKRDLFSSDASLEKFARERYFMKRNNEDVFIIIEE